MGGGEGAVSPAGGELTPEVWSAVLQAQASIFKARQVRLLIGCFAVAAAADWLLGCGCDC